MDVHLNANSIKDDGQGGVTGDLVLCSGDTCVPIRVSAKERATLVLHAEARVTKMLGGGATIDSLAAEAPLEIVDPSQNSAENERVGQDAPTDAQEPLGGLGDQGDAATSGKIGDLFVMSEEQFWEVVRQPRLSVVDWTASWCGPCQQISPLVHELAHKYPAVNIIKVDVDVLRALKRQQGVKAMPTFHFMFAGQKFHQLVGAAPKSLAHYVDAWQSANSCPDAEAVKRAEEGAPGESLSWATVVMFAGVLALVAALSFAHELLRMLDVLHFVVPFWVFLEALSDTLSFTWRCLLLFMFNIGLRYIPFINKVRLPISEYIVGPFQSLYRTYFPDDPDNAAT